MNDQFIILLGPGRDGIVDSPTDEEVARLDEHSEYLERLADEGVVILAGHTTEPPVMGLIILRAADREAAESVMNDDPAVKAKVLTARLSPFNLVLTAHPD